MTDYLLDGLFRQNYRNQPTEQDTAMTLASDFYDSWNDEFPRHFTHPVRTAAFIAAQAEANRVDRLRRELQAAERDLAERQRKESALADAIDRFGTDDRLVDGCVIMFNKTFSTNRAKVYNYAAIRAGGRWFTTGPKSPKSYTWVELISWMVGSDPVNPGVTDIHVVTGVGSLVDGRMVVAG